MDETQEMISQDRAVELFFARVVRGECVDDDAFVALCQEHPRWVEVFELLRSDLEVSQPALAGVVATEPGADAHGVFAALHDGGRRADRFRFLGELGRGGMGVVRRVWDPELRRVVALKTLLPTDGGHGGDPLWVERAHWRLLSEAQIVGQLQHPGIVPVHEVGMTGDDHLYFTMPVVAGEGFDRVLARVREGEPAWSTARAVGVLLRVAETVSYAHARSVLHRDLKPTNIMVGAFGQAYVMDWGLARVMGAGVGPAEPPQRPAPDAAVDRADDDSDTGEVSSTRQDLRRKLPQSPLLSHVGDVIGTPAYMAPEQALGRLDEIDEGVDIYSLGALLYELLAGTAPFRERRRSGARAEVLEAVRRGPPTRIRRLAPHAPEELVAICEKAMAVQRSERYAKAEDLADDLRAFLEVRVVKAHRTGALVELGKWMRRHRAVVAVMALLLATLVGSVIGFAALYRSADDQRRAAQRAQADAVRRIGALRGYGPNLFALPTFADDFSDGRIDRTWIATSGTHLVEESDGALRLTAAPASSDGETVLAQDRMVAVIRGAFELTVALELIGFDTPEQPRHERIAGLSLHRCADASYVAGIERHAECEPPACVGAAQTYRGGFENAGCEGSAWVARDDRKCTVRVTRDQGMLRQEYWDDAIGWVELRADSVDDQDLFLRFFCRNFYVSTPFVMALQDLRFRSLAPPALVSTDLDIDLEDGWIDPRLVVRSNNGVVAELDSAMYMEKLEGDPGFVSLGLDSTRYVLRGDFDLGFSFDLQRFPVPLRGAHSLRFRVLSADSVSFATVELRETPGARAWHLRYRGHTLQQPTDVRAGRLRVQRRGEDIYVASFEDGAWRLLLHREKVDPSLGMSFDLELRADDSAAGLMVALRDMRATHLQPR